MSDKIINPGTSSGGSILGELEQLPLDTAGNVITFDTDWGAPGAQLTGAQVQAFIKAQLKSLSGNVLDLKNITSELRAACDGCFVAYYNDWEDEPRIATYWEWPEIVVNTIERGDPILAIGVLVAVPGQEPFIVLAKEESLAWSNSNFLADVEEYADEAFRSFDGKSKTAKIIAKMGGKDMQGSAAAYCLDYSKYIEDEENGLICGIGRGMCWLPSLGEAWTMRTHKDAINRCLSVIEGADLLEDWTYWTSSEVSSQDAFYVNMGDGFIGGNMKINPHNVRPVTSYR